MRSGEEVSMAEIAFWFCVNAYNEERPGEFVAVLCEVVDEDGQDDGDDEGREESEGANEMEWEGRIGRRFYRW